MTGLESCSHGSEQVWLGQETQVTRVGLPASTLVAKSPAIMAGHTAPGASRILGSQTCTNLGFLCGL